MTSPNTHYGLIIEGSSDDIHIIHQDLSIGSIPVLMNALTPYGKVQDPQAFVEATRRQTMYTMAPLDTSDQWCICIIVPLTDIHLDVLKNIARILHERQKDRPVVSAFTIIGDVYAGWIYDHATDAFTCPYTLFVSSEELIKKLEPSLLRPLIHQTLPGGDFTRKPDPVPTHEQFLKQLEQTPPSPVGRLFHVRKDG